MVNTEGGTVSRIETGGLLDNAADALARKFSANKKPIYRMCADLADQADGPVILYELGG